MDYLNNLYAQQLLNNHNEDIDIDNHVFGFKQILKGRFKEVK